MQPSPLNGIKKATAMRSPFFLWRRWVPNPMLQYADIQFLVSLVSYFGHGLSTMLHDQSLSSFCHELSDNVKVRFSDFKRHFSDNCFLILPL